MDGTHRGEFLGIPATGRTVRVWGILIDILEDGRIKDTRIIMDTSACWANSASSLLRTLPEA